MKAGTYYKDKYTSRITGRAHHTQKRVSLWKAQTAGTPGTLSAKGAAVEAPTAGTPGTLSVKSAPTAGTPGTLSVTTEWPRGAPRGLRWLPV
jgi:hypothetical protein